MFQHNDWYTEDGFDYLRRLVRDFPFTPKQRATLANPPQLSRDDSDDYGGYDSDYW